LIFVHPTFTTPSPFPPISRNPLDPNPWSSRGHRTPRGQRNFKYSPLRISALACPTFFFEGSRVQGRILLTGGQLPFFTQPYDHWFNPSMLSPCAQFWFLNALAVPPMDIKLVIYHYPLFSVFSPCSIDLAVSFFEFFLPGRCFLL